MDYQSYIKTELLVLIPVLYFIGLGLKKSKIPDKKIPVVLGIIAIVLCAVWVLAMTNIATVKEILLAIFISVTQGILIAGASVYVNQIYVQSKKEE